MNKHKIICQVHMLKCLSIDLIPYFENLPLNLLHLISSTCSLISAAICVGSGPIYKFFSGRSFVQLDSHSHAYAFESLTSHVVFKKHQIM